MGFKDEFSPLDRNLFLRPVSPVDSTVFTTPPHKYILIYNATNYCI